MNGSAAATSAAKYTACVVLASRSYAGTLGTIRSLGKRGVPVFVAAHDSERGIFSSSRYCAGLLPVSMDWNWSRIREGLLGWRSKGACQAPPMLIPLSDQACSFMAANREELHPAFFLAMPDNEVVARMQDKFQACTAAAASGLDVPPFGLADSPQALRQIAGRIRYPAIVKPNRWDAAGICPFKTQTVQSAQQLIEEGTALLGNQATLIIQEFVPGGDRKVSFCMFYRRRDGRSTQLCTGIKRLQLPPGAGIMAYGEAVAMPSLAAKSLAFLERVGYSGLGGLEFKSRGGKDYFIELNTRIEAIHPLAIKAGVDFPWLAYADLMLGQAPAEPLPQKPAYWLDEVAAFELFRDHRAAGALFRETARLLFSSMTTFAVWSPSDVKPWVRVLLKHGRSILRKRFQCPQSSCHAV